LSVDPVISDVVADSLNTCKVYSISCGLYLVIYGDHKTTRDDTADRLQLTTCQRTLGSADLYVLYNSTSFGHMDL
jgi:hypothetical protein